MTTTWVALHIGAVLTVGVSPVLAELPGLIGSATDGVAADRRCPHNPLGAPITDGTLDARATGR